MNVDHRPNQTEKPVVENATEARQGRGGNRVLTILIAGLALAAVAWAASEFWGQSTAPPTEQTATPPAGEISPEAPADAPAPPP